MSRRGYSKDKKRSTKDWKPCFVFVSTGPKSPFTDFGHPSFCRVTPPKPNATLLSITRKLYGKEAIKIRSVVTKESLAELGFEFIRDELRHQLDLLSDLHGRSADYGPFVEQEGLGDEMEEDLLLGHLVGGKKRKRDTAPQVKQRAEAEERKLQDEVGRLTRELLEEKKRSSDLAEELLGEKSHSARLEEEKSSLSSEVGSTSARVVELEGEKVELVRQLEAKKGDQARCLEEAIEAFKASPEFVAVSMERMDKLVL
ncbi:unnamed protein product [Cuscuta campestris]|uniref:Uncharacterized protein n=1 Tax=Cuscuta campestris TaxID=132261 RepID=A0A484LI03_9ASTE|nr:unnamed protein product [Cuscuta campestris]